MHENHGLRQSAARTDLSLSHLPGIAHEEGLLRETRSAPEIHVTARRRLIWASKSRIGLGVGILAMVSLGVMGSVWLRAGGDGKQQIDDHGHVMVEPMTNALPLNPMPNPKNAEEGLSRELAKLIPYRMYMMVNNKALALNFTAYRPPHKYKDNYWHFEYFDRAHHLKDVVEGRKKTLQDVGSKYGTKGFDFAEQVSLDLEHIAFKIMDRLDTNSRGRAHRLSNRTAIPVSEAVAGQIVFTDPVLPILTILRTSVTSHSEARVWPFGELHESALRNLNALLLDADIDERVASTIYIESIQLPSYDELKKYGAELRKIRQAKKDQ